MQGRLGRITVRGDFLGSCFGASNNIYITVPQTNVLWLSYLLDYLIAQYTTHGPAKKKSSNREEIEYTFAALEDWLNFDPKIRVGDGDRFASAGECLDFCVEIGWISEDQLNEDVNLSCVDGEQSFTQRSKEVRENLERSSARRQNNANSGAGDVDVTKFVVEGIVPITPRRTEMEGKPRHTFFSPVIEKTVSQSQSTRVLRSRTPSPVKAVESSLGVQQKRRPPSPTKSKTVKPITLEPLQKSQSRPRPKTQTAKQKDAEK